MKSDWKQLSTMWKMLYIGGLVSFIGLVVMILSGVASIDEILMRPVKFCPWCM